MESFLCVRQRSVMNKIQVLPPEVANMIAAGEVVERPASVVKELLENAVDALATEIRVEITKGGLESLRISDNGTGISTDELETAFLRHATSKLKNADNLARIATLGFRGEALAAIASVSKISVESRKNGKDFGNSLYLEAGNVLKREEVGVSVGTTITVSDIFYNTPARKKFLKSERSEGGAIFALVQEVALSHPEISVKFVRDQKEEMNTTGDGKLETAIFHVLGKNLVLGMRPVQLADRTTSMEGFVSLPSCCRGSRAGQHFFVNGRYVKSTLMMAALEEAYRNQKMVGKFPAAVIHLKLNYDELDVNVHPAKTQVKFLHEKEIFQIVHRAVVLGLEKCTDIQRVELSGHNTDSNTIDSHENSPTEKENSPEFTEKSPSIVDENTVFQNNSPETWVRQFHGNHGNHEIHSSIHRGNSGYSVNSREFPTELPSNSNDNLQFDEKNQSDIKIDRDFSKITSGAMMTENMVQNDDFVQSSPEKFPEYEDAEIENYQEGKKWRIVGEFFRTYIAVELDDEVFFIDKHAAHERMLFDKLKTQGFRPMAQELLKPITLQLSPEELECLLSQQELLEEFSFDVEEFSSQSVIIRQAPDNIPVERIPETLLELVQKLIYGETLDPDSARDHLLHTVACKAAIKAGYNNVESEQRVLVELAMENKVKHCPHGRPIMASLSKKELEKKFKRIQ